MNPIKILVSLDCEEWVDGQTLYMRPIDHEFNANRCRVEDVWVVTSRKPNLYEGFVFKAGDEAEALEEQVATVLQDSQLSKCWGCGKVGVGHMGFAGYSPGTAYGGYTVTICDADPHCPGIKWVDEAPEKGDYFDAHDCYGVIVDRSQE